MRRILIRVVLFLLLFTSAIASALAVVFFLQYRNVNNDLVSKSTEVATLTAEKKALQEKYDTLLATPAKECYAQSADSWVVVNHPCAGEKLEKLFQFNGIGTGLFESTLSYVIVDADGKELAKGSVTTNAPDMGLPGTFDKAVKWDATATGNGKFIAFESSAKDGSRVHVVEIPVTFE